MVGKSILLEALEDDRIKKILLINRNSLELQHAKVQEVLLQDFTQISKIKKELSGYDAIFHCMGVSAAGLSEEQYINVTYSASKAIADELYAINPQMSFSYVSGVGTDSSEKSRIMWTRVKGRTENYILAKKFKHAYMIRLGAILPEKGIKSRTKWYNIFYFIFGPVFPLMKRSKSIITTTNFGKAMLNSLFYPPENTYLENKQMNALAIDYTT